MKNLLLILFLATTFNLQAKTIFVKQGTTGEGTSWNDATGNLHAALSQATAGDQIWVAKGKYLTSQTGDRHASFRIPEGISLLGGFAGFESSATQRNPQVNATILSGEIGSPSIDDNAYTIVYTNNVSAKTAVDGFTITGAAANGYGKEGDLKRCGGGWYNNGANPTISNCVFTRNYARDGAGLFNNGQNQESSPKIVNCIFTQNKADLDGGAIYNYGANGKSNPTILNCQLADNEATYGAGIMNVATYGESCPKVLDCVFQNNHSYIRGAGIYNAKENGNCQPVIQNCQFADNTASVGRTSTNNTSAQETKSSIRFSRM